MSSPPRLARSLLKWYAGRAELEDLLGDLDEVYGQKAVSIGPYQAKINYWRHILSVLFSYGLKKRKNQSNYSNYYFKNSMGMFKNYFKISFRNLRKQKTFTIINTLGLSIGMSIALLALAMYVDLKQFDTYHPYANDTYRVTTEIVQSGDKEKYASAPPALTYAMDEGIPSIYQSVHIDESFSVLTNHNGNDIRAHGYFTEPSFFELFSFQLEEGSPTVLNEPGKVILTKELATKLYKDRSPIGLFIETKEWGTLQVGGVLKSFPKQTHLRFELLVGFPLSKKFDAIHKSTQWRGFTESYFYFAAKDQDIESLKNQMNAIGKNGNPEFAKDELTARYGLQALLDITPGELINDGIGIQFDMPTMLLFFGISLLILVPACFNYTNMSIAIALKRAKEVGIRKVMGSYKKHIIYQFLVETVLICLSSVLISATLFYFLRDQFTRMVVGGSALSFEITPSLVLVFIGFAILTGILTGLGPALYFAKISPIKALRSASSQAVNISGIRKGLLVFQFTLTLVFMIGTGVLVKQYQETKHFDLPFDTEKTFVIYNQDQDAKLLLNELSAVSAISELSLSSNIPGTSLSKSIYAHDKSTLDSFRIREVIVDEHFIDHMNLTLVWGNQLEDIELQKESVVVNEEMVTRLKRMKFDTSLIQLSNGKVANIVGIVENYNQEPLNESIEPMMLRMDTEELNFTLVTIPSGDPISNVVVLEQYWDRLFPEVPFQATLLETEIDNAYGFFMAGIRIFGFLAFLAISISCLGLLGMVIYSTSSKTKEVAIRKILGASKKSLFGTLAGMFVKLWAIALTIAIPGAYFFYDSFLVRIYNKFGDGVGPLEILLSVCATLLLGGMAIFWQVNKISNVNPSENLRYE